MKILNYFLVGFLLTLAPIFTLFVGLKTNYFDHYGINEYFNIIFADNVPFLTLAPLYFIVGYAFFLAPFRRYFRAFYVLALLASLASWVPDFGLRLGEIVFSSKVYETNSASQNDSLENAKIYRILYFGRDSVYILPDGAKKAIKQKLPK